jgi:hypothetical protein
MAAWKLCKEFTKINAFRHKREDLEKISPNIIQNEFHKAEISPFSDSVALMNSLNQKHIENAQGSRKAKKLLHCRQHLMQKECNISAVEVSSKLNYFRSISES